MGDQGVATDADDRTRRAFVQAVLEDIEGLERLIAEGRIETGIRRVGAEQEMFLIDGARQPAPLAGEVLDRISDERLTTELAKFNLEANLTPRVFGGDCLGTMEAELHEVIALVRKEARTLGAAPTLAGILPTLRLTHLSLENMTPMPRYYQLNEAISALRDGAFEIVIKGLDELDITHDNVMLEAANTSFQIHFQVAPDEFAPLYNLAQAISAPVLAAAVNSPLLLGHRLWNETRVALFQRSTDMRSATHKRRANAPRVSFGQRWIKDSIVEVYKDDVTRFRIVLATDDLDENPLKLIDQGQVPKLRALRMHTSTVWRWNRACYGVHEGKPHLRIENRILPAGPSVVDEMANAAFFFGLMSALSEDYPRIDEVMAFDDAKNNFYAAARHGLNAQFTWIDGRTLTAHDLICNELLPAARRGLEKHDIASADIDRYLEVIRGRVTSRQTGSEWALQSLKKMGNAPIDVRLRSLTTATWRNQQTDKPVHEWPLAELHRTRDWFPSYRTVGQFMSSELYTVRPEDPVSLAARMMDWRQIRHIPVEDNHGKLVGILSFRDLVRLVAKPDVSTKEITVSSIMRNEPITVSEHTPTLTALTMMKERNIGSLPVVDKEGKLVGLVTVYDLLEIADKVLRDFLVDEAVPSQARRTMASLFPSTPPSDSDDG